MGLDRRLESARSGIRSSSPFPLARADESSAVPPSVRPLSARAGAIDPVPAYASHGAAIPPLAWQAARCAGIHDGRSPRLHRGPDPARVLVRNPRAQRWPHLELWAEHFPGGYAGRPRQRHDPRSSLGVELRSGNLTDFRVAGRVQLNRVVLGKPHPREYVLIRNAGHGSDPTALRVRSLRSPVESGVRHSGEHLISVRAPRRSRPVPNVCGALSAVERVMYGQCDRRHAPMRGLPRSTRHSHLGFVPPRPNVCV
jgi:hypothetical protein